MPENSAVQDILRCPNCGSNAIIWGDLEHNSYVMCKACNMRGPSAGTDSSAIEKWNYLPRKLKWWSQGAPAVDGLYVVMETDNTMMLRPLKAGETPSHATMWAGPVIVE